MSKIIFEQNVKKTKPKFKDSEIKGLYCFGEFNKELIFEICTSSKQGSKHNSSHYRQVIDINKEQAIILVNLLKNLFNI